jgi:hypothetical protein
VSGRGYRFVAEIRTSIAATDAEICVDRGAAAETSQSTPSSKLPTAVSSVIGRETEFEEVSRLPADVVDLVDTSTAPRRPSRHIIWRLFGSGLVLVVVASFSWLLYSRNQAFPEIRSIAVLPFDSLSGDASQDYFADGMTDELITDLGQIRTLRVISRTSIMTYKRVRKLHAGGDAKANKVTECARLHRISGSADPRSIGRLAAKRQVARASEGVNCERRGPTPNLDLLGVWVLELRTGAGEKIV